jgi:hypothetical protein
MLNKILSIIGKKNINIEKTIEYNVPKTLVDYIKDNIFFFSVCKSKEEMKILSSSLLTESNEIKPFYKFHHEVQKMYSDCNSANLENEYNLAIACALSVQKWNDNDSKDERYSLQLREFQGKEFTLPSSDSFWGKFYPPNDWTDNNFFVLLVRKSKYPQSNSIKAQEYMSKKVSVLFQYDFRYGKFPIDRFIDFHLNRI